MKERKNHIHSIGKLIALCFYLSIVFFCILNREKITLDAIISYTPEKPILAAVVMLALFALKGCTVFLNGNLLYAASGVLFPLPVAISVNALGTVLMTATPFLLGRRAGADAMNALKQKYRKLEVLADAPQQSEFACTLFLRLFGILPCEPIGMYLGACSLHFGKYIAGTMLGLAPAIVMYAIIGAYIAEPTSPQFLVSVIIQTGTTICSLGAALIWERQKNRKG